MKPFHNAFFPVSTKDKKSKLKFHSFNVVKYPYISL